MTTGKYVRASLLTVILLQNNLSVHTITIAVLLVISCSVSIYAQSTVDITTYSLGDVVFKEPTSSSYMTHLIHDADSGYYMLIGNDEDETAIVKLDSALRVKSQKPFLLPVIDSIQNNELNSFDATYSIGDSLYLFKSFKTPYSSKRNGVLLVCYLYVANNNSIETHVVAREYSVSLTGYYVVAFNEKSKTFGVCYIERMPYKKPQSFSVMALDRNLTLKASAKFNTNLTVFSFVSDLIVDDSSNVYIVTRTTVPKTKGIDKRHVIAAIKCNPFQHSYQTLIVDSSKYVDRQVDIRLIDKMLFVVTINGTVSSTNQTGGGTDVDSKSLGVTMVNINKFELINYVPFELNTLDKTTEEAWSFSDLVYNERTKNVFVIFNKTPSIFTKDKTFLFNYPVDFDSIVWIQEIPVGSEESPNPTGYRHHHFFAGGNDGNYFVLPIILNSSVHNQNTSLGENVIAVSDTAYRVESDALRPVGVIRQPKEEYEMSVLYHEDLYKYRQDDFIIGTVDAKNGMGLETKELRLVKISFQ